MTAAQSDEQQHPGRAVDYALINMGYVSALAGIGAVLQRRGDEIDLSRARWFC